MATGKSGKISITGTKNMSAVLYWSETYDVATNTHVVKIDNIKFKSSNWYGFTYRDRKQCRRINCHNRIRTMAINKVVYGTTVLVDLTNDTVRPESMLLGTRAHACNGDMIEGTLNRSQTGILVQIEGVTPAYKSAKSVTIDLSEFTSIYQQITGEQIIVEFTHLDLYAPGLILGGSIDTEITLSYEASTGIITLSTTESIFQSSVKCVANVYITEQVPSIIKPEQTKSTSPSTDQITINPDSGYTLSSVTVEPITGTLLSSLNTDFRADNIRKDIDLFGITGTLDPSGGSFNPYPWKDIEVGTITPSSNTTTLNIDESKGTPLALVISLADMHGISQSNNAIYNASFSTSNVKANPAHIVVYQGALSVGTSTSYPTYSNGAFNLNKQLKAGWTYNYMVAYG